MKRSKAYDDNSFQVSIPFKIIMILFWVKKKKEEAKQKKEISEKN